jgi:type IV secretion system protein VirB4
MGARDKIGSVLDLHTSWGVHDGFVLTKKGSLIGAIELSGRDPDGMAQIDHVGLMHIARVIYTKLPKNLCITQYYAHFEGAQIHLKKREHPVSDLLSRRRAEFLNGRGLCNSRLIHMFEIMPPDDFNKLDIPGLMKHLTMAAFSPTSRRAVSQVFSKDGSLLYIAEQLDRQSWGLKDALQVIEGKWSGVMGVKRLDTQEMWAFMRFLATLQPRRLDTAMEETPPKANWDQFLASGDVRHMRVNRMDVLKVEDTDANYMKIAAISRLGSPVREGLWGNGEDVPARLRGNYLLMQRFTPYSEFKRSMMFGAKQKELERGSIDPWAVLQGNERSLYEKRATMKPAIAQKIEELGEAEALDEVWGTGHSFIAAFNDDPAKLRDTVLSLDRASSNAGLSLVWEGVDLPYAYQTLQPGGQHKSMRDLVMNGTQNAAASLVYQSAIGQPRVEDLGGEEAQYVMESSDGRPFFYSSFIGGRAMLVGIGPIRSGKTFFKNTLATHFLKYGGVVRAVDIDPGTETLAQAFGEDGGIFRVTSDGSNGLNPFVNYQGEGDVNFIVHMTELLLEMMRANDDPNLRELAHNEQEYLDGAIRKTLLLPDDMRTLDSLVAHMPMQLAQKFTRWTRGNDADMAGRYAPLFAAQRDSAGGLDKRVAVYNLQAVRDDENAMRPLLLELFYRITRTFEDPRRRGIPKELHIDECHHALRIKSFAEYLVSKVRTWGKWGAGVQMWTQSPEELLRSESWAAVRSACSTFVFMADPKMDDNLYRETFPFLQPGECEAIRSLVPKRQAFVVQQELGVSKVVNLAVEPEQYVMNTSHPREAAIRTEWIEQFGYEEGINRTLQRFRAEGILK